ncbi:hypothetical protein [Microbacterium rhizomatis]|uniref:Uncharacterized protein n=1 Tax=Microbacterium rhizomatis TaxID=1631477 RepID=A0A5J5J5P9_9MICO|nr:hypothetical protein [Microbacterium rhizomatis]KAA9111382.1 hypothetical protein F6B43_07335 [Microbacterium rhizomatis]
MTEPHASPVPVDSIAPPRTRWAAIVWGTFFAAVAATGLWILPDAARRAAVGEWMLALTPTTGIAVAVLGVGVIVLVAGLSAVLPRAQRRVRDE